MPNLILHILLYAVVVYAIGLMIRWWSKREDVHVSGVFWLGLSTIIVASSIFGVSIVGFGALPDAQRSELFALSERGEVGLMWVVLAVFLLFALWRISEIAAEAMRLIMIKKTSWGAIVGAHAFHSGDGDLRELEKKRIVLQEFIRDETRNEKVVLRWSSKIQLPFTVGIVSPSIYVPLWAIRKKSSSCVEQLVHHECEHIKSRHNLWIWLLRMIFFIIPFTAPILKAIRHAFEADSDRKLMKKLDEQSRKEYINTLETVVAPASGSGLEVGLGHDRRNIPLRIKQSVSEDRAKYQIVIITFAWLMLYAAVAAFLGRVDFSALGKAFDRKIPANYAMVVVDEGAKITPIVGKGGDISTGIKIDTTACGPDGRVVVGIGRSDARYDYDPWEGFEGSALIEIKRTGGNNSKYPILAGTGYQYEFYSEGAIIANVVDKDLAIIDKNARYVTTISKASSPGDVSSAMNWEIVVPSGWRVRLTDVRFRPYSGPRRPVNQVLEKQKMHLDLAPLGKADFDQTWDLKGRPFFAD